MKIRFILTILLFVTTHQAWSESTISRKYTNRLTPSLETDALSIMVTGSTFTIAQKLCNRLGDNISSNLKIEFDAWNKRNNKYIQGAAQAINEFANLYNSEEGESAKQAYLNILLYASASAAKQRLTKQLKGHSIENDNTPPEGLCTGLTKWLHDGVADIEREPHKIMALQNYLQSSSVTVSP